MDIVANTFLILIGLLLGGLLVLVADTYFLGRRVQSAMAEKRRTQEALRNSERKLARSERRAHQLTRDLEEASQQFARQAAETGVKQQALEDSQAELDALQDNLARISNYADELRDAKVEAQARLAAATAKVEILQNQVNQLSEEIRELREKYEQTCQRLIATEVEMKHLKVDLDEAQTQAQLESRLKDEKRELEYQLSAANQKITELANQAAEAREQVAEAQETSQHLEMTEEQLELAETEIDELEDKLDSARVQLEHAGLTGKSQLEIVRGIGPVYARRLHEAGIVSLADLAKQTPRRVFTILGLKKWMADKPADWIQEARVLAAALSDEESPSEDADLQAPTDPSQSEQ